MDLRSRLDQICREHGLLSVYLFGSRADDGLGLLAGKTVTRAGSDLDVALVFLDREFDVWELSKLQVELEDLFEPLRVDLVPLQKVDPIFAFRAIDGHCIAETDATRNAYFELDVMRLAAELALLQKINRGLSSGADRRYRELVVKRRAETLTSNEHTELLELTEDIETWQAERVKHLIDLARIRGMSLSELMDELGIEAPPVE